MSWVSLQVIALNAEHAQFYRATNRAWRFFFYPESYDWQTYAASADVGLC